MPYSTTGLPVLPYTMTTEFDGIKYEVHPLTNVCQVITEDGILLCDVLDGLATKKELADELKNFRPDTPWFQLKGTLRHLPEMTAIEQLYAKATPLTGEVWLVEASPYGAQDKIFDMYAYSESITNWIYVGTTQKKSPIESNDVLKLFPTELGKPGQYLVVDPTGKGITWGWGGLDPEAPQDVTQHNLDSKSHADIRAAIDLKADKLLIFNAVIRKDDWVWDGVHPFYTYIFSHENLEPDCYFELTAVGTTKEEINNAAKSGILGTYAINSSETGSYAILQATHIPESDVEVCVKSYGKYITNKEDPNQS